MEIKEDMPVRRPVVGSQPKGRTIFLYVGLKLSLTVTFYFPPKTFEDSDEQNTNKAVPHFRIAQIYILLTLSFINIA